MITKEPVFCKDTEQEWIPLVEQLREHVTMLRKSIEDAAFRATHGECAHVILICDEALSATEPKEQGK